AGSPVDGLAGHYFTVLAHLDTTLCDPDPDIPLTTWYPPPVGATEGLVVFPSPASSQITVTAPAVLAPARLRLFDAQGRLIQDRPFMGPSITLDLSHCTSGLYTLRLSQGSTERSKRFIVTHSPSDR